MGTRANKKKLIYDALPREYQALIRLDKKGVPKGSLGRLQRIQLNADKGLPAREGIIESIRSGRGRTKAYRGASAREMLSELSTQREFRDLVKPEMLREMGFEVHPVTGKLTATREEQQRRQQEEFLRGRQLLGMGYGYDPETGDFRQLSDAEIRGQLSPEQQRQYDIYKQQQERILEGQREFGDAEKAQYRRFLEESEAAGGLVPGALGLAERGMEFAGGIFDRSLQAAEHLGEVRDLGRVARGELLSAYDQRRAAEEQLYDVYGLMGEARGDYETTAGRVQDLLAGKGEVSAGLEFDLREQEKAMRERLRRQYGPNYENTTGGMQALAQFKTQANIARDTSRREQLPASIQAMESFYGAGVGRGTGELYGQAVGAGLGELYGQGIGRDTMELYQQTLGYGAGEAAGAGIGALGAAMGLSTGRLGEMREAFYGGPQFAGVGQYGAEAGLLGQLQVGADRGGYFGGILAGMPTYGGEQAAGVMTGMRQADVQAALGRQQQELAQQYFGLGERQFGLEQDRFGLEQERFGLQERQFDWGKYRFERQQQFQEWMGEMDVMLRDKGLDIRALQGTSWGAGVGLGGRGGGGSGLFGQLAGAGIGAAGSVLSALALASDERLKEGIKPIESASDILSKLKPVRFTWKQTGEEDIGHIAQQVEEVLPEAVHGNDIRWLTPLTLIGLLVKGWQELYEELQEVKNANVR